MLGAQEMPASKAAPLTFQRPQKKSSKNSVMASVPTGPKGKKRPSDVIGSAVKVMRIATGEESEDFGPEDRQEPSRRRVRPHGREEARRGHDTRTARGDCEKGGKITLGCQVRLRQFAAVAVAPCDEPPPYLRA
jgi:hypothetical protein